MQRQTVSLQFVATAANTIRRTVISYGSENFTSRAARHLPDDHFYAFPIEGPI